MSTSFFFESLNTRATGFICGVDHRRPAYDVEWMCSLKMFFECEYSFCPYIVSWRTLFQSIYKTRSLLTDVDYYLNGHVQQLCCLGCRVSGTKKFDKQDTPPTLFPVFKQKKIKKLTKEKQKGERKIYPYPPNPARRGFFLWSVLGLSRRISCFFHIKTLLCFTLC